MRVQTVFRAGVALALTVVAVAAAGCRSSQGSASSSSASDSAKTQATSGGAAKQTSTPGIPPMPTTLAAPAGATEPLFNGMRSHHRAVTTSSKPAQTYFDQGLVFAYSFNHDEAIKSFKQAAEFDPNCAMAYWGIALCNGPHINNPVMDEAHIAAAWEAVQTAQSLRENASEVERALIDALAARYSSDPKAERAALDHAYAEAMAKVYKKYPKDTDVAALYCESLMDLRPWDLWSHEKEPRPETPTIVATLELVLVQDPKHPLANHLYIHAVEAGPTPQKGVTAANTLRTLVPGAGHMVHMPAHIDIRTGRWDLAAKQNQEAMAIDRNYRAVSPKQGFYNIYMAHNPQFLSFADMMRGRRESAMSAMHTMINGVPQEFIDNMPAAIDGYLVIQYECPMRFGLWDEILAIPEPNEKLKICTAMRYFTRAVAYSAKGQPEDAIKEQAAFRKAVEAIPPDAIMAINKAHTVMTLADHVLNGEMAYQRGDIDTAVKELTEAVKIEDTLLYMEPPDWLVPARHALGAVLVSAKRTSEAEAVYRADLIAWPENGWALFGLWQCLDARKDPEAALVKRRFDKVWDGADTPLTTSCMCVAKK